MKNSEIKQQAGSGQEGQPVLALTPRETQCIAQALQGKNTLQISEELKISPKTVFYYLNSVQMKISQLGQRIAASTK